MSRVKTLKAALSAAVVATLLLAAAPAAASAKLTVTFAASPGSSARFVHNDKAIRLHVAGNRSTAHAVALVHHFPKKLPSMAPSFQATFYQSGTPRWYIKFKNGDHLFGYPTINLWEARIPGGGRYGSYAAMAAFVKANSGGKLPKVTVVDIVADGSAPLPYTTRVTNAQYAGKLLTK